MLLRGLSVRAENKAHLERNTTGASASFVAVAALLDSDSYNPAVNAYYIDCKHLSDPSMRKVPGYGAWYTIHRSGERSITSRPGLPGRLASTPSGIPVEVNVRKGVDLKLRNGTVLKADQCIVFFDFGCYPSNI